jgi:hypothetical protein
LCRPIFCEGGLHIGPLRQRLPAQLATGKFGRPRWWVVEGFEGEVRILVAAIAEISSFSSRAPAAEASGKRPVPDWDPDQAAGC